MHRSSFIQMPWLWPALQWRLYEYSINDTLIDCGCYTSVCKSLQSSAQENPRTLDIHVLFFLGHNWPFGIRQTGIRLSCMQDSLMIEEQPGSETAAEHLLL